MIWSRRLKRAAAFAVALIVLHGIDLAVLGTSHTGSFLSDLIQVTLGISLVALLFHTAVHNTGLARSFWFLTAFSYCLWIIPQGLSTIGDLKTLPLAIQPAIKFLFSFWLLPVSLTLCLDDHSPSGGVDRTLIIDYGQGLLFIIAAYCYFRFESGFEIGLQPSVWTAYFTYYGFMAGAFFLRSALSHTRASRLLFRRMAFFLLLSAAVDLMYYYGAANLLPTGSWFDLFWTILLVYPFLMTAAWDANIGEPSEPGPALRVPGQLLAKVPALFFPISILLMAVHLGHSRLALAVVLVLASFLLSTIKQFLTQYSLMGAQELLRRQASHDGLTGAWNHLGILDILEREMLRARRTGESLGVIMIDVDHFKAVNDNHGHRCGDAVLAELARQFTGVLRPYDALGRYGGEEFVAIAPGCNVGQTRELAERIRVQIADHPVAFADKTVGVSVSIGVAVFSPGASLESLLQAADRGLYRAKNRGRNRVELDPELSAGLKSQVLRAATGMSGS